MIKMREKSTGNCVLPKWIWMFQHKSIHYAINLQAEERYLMKLINIHRIVN